MTCLAPLLLALFAAPPPPAPAPLRLPVSAHVLAVPDANHVVVARGRLDRFPEGARGLVISPRPEPSPEGATPPVELAVTLGRADVERVDERTALLRVVELTQESGRSRAPRPGDHVTWTLTLEPSEAALLGDPLFWAAIADVSATPLGQDRPFFELADLLSGPQASTSPEGARRVGSTSTSSPEGAWRGALASKRAMAAMVAELHAQADLAPRVRTAPVERGAYAGRTLEEVLAAATEADVGAFWDHVASEAPAFMTHRFKLVDIFATWVLRGAPPATRAPSRGEVLPLRTAQALRLGQWADAEALLMERLRIAPGDEARRAELDQVVALRRAEAAIGRDPRDLDALDQRARALADLGFYAAALRDLDQLLAARPTPEVERARGRALCGLRRWAECDRAFDALIAARGVRDPDPELLLWRALARSQGTSPEPSARERSLGTLADRQREAERAIVEHRVEDARRAVEQLVVAARRVPAPAQAGADAAPLRATGASDPGAGGEVALAQAMGSLSAAAASVREVALATELAERRVLLANPLGGAVLGLALADLALLQASGGPARAEALLEEAVGLAPGDLGVRAARAAFFAARQRWSDAYSAAFMDTGQSRLASLAVIRASAARGQVDQALDYAVRLAAKRPEDGLLVTAIGRLASANRSLAVALREGDPASHADAPAAPTAAGPTSLQRIRALVDLGLDALALAELPALGAPAPDARARSEGTGPAPTTPADRVDRANRADHADHADLIEAAWAIAAPTREAFDPREPVDLVPLADRLAAARLAATPRDGAPVPAERLRRLAVLEARQGLAEAVRAAAGKPCATDPTVCDARIDTARLRLAATLVSYGTRTSLHEAIALARLAPGSVAHQALAALDRVDQARDARERRDEATQLRLASAARQALDALGLAHLAARAAVLQADAEAALGRKTDALATLRAVLPRLEADGPARGEPGAAASPPTAGQPGAASRPAPDRSAYADLHAAERLLAGLRSADGDPGELARADAKLATHVVQCTAVDDERCAARAHEALGRAALDAGRASAAEKSLALAQDIYRALADRDGERRARLALAELARLRGAFDSAGATAGKVLDQALADRDGEAERGALGLLGRIALSQGDLDAAVKWLGAAQEAALRGKDRRAAAAAGARLGRVQVQRGEVDLVLDTLRRAAADLAREDRLEALTARIDLGEALVSASRRDPKRRAAWLDEAEGVAADVVAARALGRDRLTLRATLVLASLQLERGRLDLASRTLADAAPLANRLDVEGLDDLPARRDALLGRLALARHDKDAAATALIAATSRLSRSLLQGMKPLGGETDELLEAAIGLLFELGRHDEAAQVLELQRAAGAFQLELVRLSGRPDVAADVARLAEARAKNEAARARLREAHDRSQDLGAAALDALVEDVKTSDAALAPLVTALTRTSSAPLAARSLSRARERLPTDAVLVEYFVGADALYLFVVAPDPRGAGRPTLRARKVKVAAADLRRAIQRHRQLLATDATLAEPLGRDLFRWLLAPALDGLDAATRRQATLLLLPHGPLAAVPFGALVSSPPGTPTRYALEDLRLALVSTPTLHHLLSGPSSQKASRPASAGGARARPAVGPVLGLVDPDGSLHEARAELDAIALPTTVLSGRDATEARMLAALGAAPETRILHFATHARAAPEPLESALLLASGPLEVRRVAALGGAHALDGVGLVVLSACETAPALGDRPGELLSLADGFAVAGVPSVIGTLWEVDDRATRLLFASFYGALADESRPRDLLSALRDAQLALLRHEDGGRRPFADPRFWSGFQLIGDYR